jgi:peptidoglycan/LPS O-acetylase OafA/YrhL
MSDRTGEGLASSVHLAPSQVDLLNLARATGAQLVLIGHAAYYYYGGGALSSGYLGTIGVLLFFLLSGFLICSGVVQKWDRPDYGLQHYLIDRFCRIFVAYGPALLFVAAVDATSRTHPPIPGAPMQRSRVGLAISSCCRTTRYFRCCGVSAFRSGRGSSGPSGRGGHFGRSQ